MTTTIELIPHFEAEDRSRWTAVQNVRPLTERGRLQAQALADAIAATGPVHALYSSPATRCKQSLEPLAEHFKLPVATCLGLFEKWFGEDRSQLGERGFEAIESILEAHPEARVAVCSHGDLIPAAIEHLVRTRSIERPPELASRGQWYTVRFLDDGRVEVSRNRQPPGFPS